MEEEKDEIIAICSTENTGNTRGMWVPCRGACRRTVWLSDSTINAMKESNPQINLEINPPIVLCIECGLPQLKKDGSAPILVPPTAEQLEELKKGIISIANKR